MIHQDASTQGVGAVVTKCRNSNPQENTELTSGHDTCQVARDSAKWRNCSMLRSILWTALTLLFLTLSACALDAPQPKTHKLFDSKNLVSLTLLAGATAGDGYTTRDLLTTPGFREANPTWRPFTGSTAGTVSISALSFASTISLMAVSHHFEQTQPHHRRIWHVIERVTPLVAVGLETRAFAHNLQQPSLQPPTTICQNSGCMVGKL